MADVNIGEVINNKLLAKIFQCSGQSGMRRSLKTGTLVVISDISPNRKSPYENRWDGPILHYTGMGQKGDQDINASQNRTLNESRTNGVRVHLFEKLEQNQYLYQGEMRLASEPYTERQTDSEGKDRQVIVFPIIRTDGSTPSITASQLNEVQIKREKKAKTLSTEELEKRARSASDQTSIRSVVTTQYARRAVVTELAKRRANGICQLCEQPAPFNNKKGEPYLETHHIVWMSKGGLDTPENTVALCPNCHRRMHIVDSKKDIAKLQKKAS